jgi:GTP-binding protein HflX
VDAASGARDTQVEDVDKVLAEIGASAIPQVLVWNKIDRNGAQPGVDRDEYARIRRVRLSAKTGDGVDGLRRALIEAAASRTSPASPPKPTDSQRQAATGFSCH